MTAHTEANKAVIRRFHEAANSRDVALIGATIDEVVTSDAVIRTPLQIGESGPALLKAVFTRLLHGYPDLRVTIEDLIAEDDKVVSRNTVTGTHLGEYMGQAATHKPIRYSEIFVCRLTERRIAETWGVVDELSQLHQIGAVPGGPASACAPAASTGEVDERS